MQLPARFATWTIAVLVAVGFGWDATRPPARQWSTWAVVGAVRVYQRTASPWMPTVGVRCRFTPTCSRYAVAVLEHHGILRGTALTLWRVARCGPWTRAGSTDPPP